MKMTTVLVAMLIGLALSGRSEAHSAWVLWKKSEWIEVRESRPTTDINWELDSAWDTHDDCDSALHGAWTAVGQSAKRDKHAEVRLIKDFSVHFTLPANKNRTSTSFLSLTFYCFPETVDPREK